MIVPMYISGKGTISDKYSENKRYVVDGYLLWQDEKISAKIYILNKCKG